MSDLHQAQLDRMRSGPGFIAALDQSGGSTPKALADYGIPPEDYDGDEEMFDLVHAMRTRVVTDPSFTADRIRAVILFDQTMERQIEGQGSAEYLWQRRDVVPVLKIDDGLADTSDGVQLLKPIPELADRLARATAHGVFGTKMRSVIHEAGEDGVRAIVDQQFAIGAEILAAGLVPILEPEVDINSDTKAEAEEQLHAALLEGLDRLPDDRQVMLKLSLPTVPDRYADLVAHPRVLLVVALSGGYSQAEACDLLARDHGVVASFSRALLEGLTAQQTDAEFHATLSASIDAIWRASDT